VSIWRRIFQENPARTARGNYSTKSTVFIGAGLPMEILRLLLKEVIRLDALS
jgi:hypothetical protein